MALVTTVPTLNADHAVDEELLHRHQPVLAFDDRELFFPTSVERYVDACELWQGDTCLIDEVSPYDLDHRWGSDVHLRFVSPSERRDAFGREVGRTARRLVSPRLGLVGLFGRIVDALFLMLVMLRPTTPKATAMAADRKARRLGTHEDPVCYARVVASGEWLVLHYAWLYPMNDWRSGYRGMNDHEGDWEQAWVFCDPVDRSPQWVATSNHDYAGADLRRHWSDPELVRDGDRPVLYVGAGSHALFFSAGDYVTRFDLPGLRWLAWLQHVGRRIVGAADDTRRGIGPAVGIPFVDYARGDGRRLEEAEVVSFASAAWCEGFRGLWGLDTRDPLHAERGPSGPKFDRKGQVRRSWVDPLGHAGLHGTLPPSALRSRVNLEKIDRAIGDLNDQVRAQGRYLPLAQQANPDRQGDGSSRALSELLRQRAELTDLRQRVAAGYLPDAGVRDHLRRPLERLGDGAGSSGFVTVWALFSIPLILGTLGVSLMVDRLAVVPSTALAVATVGTVEQLVRRRFRVAARFVAVASLLAAIVAVAARPVLSVTHYVIGGLMISAAVALVVVNVAEWLRARVQRAAGSD
ncbi:MAG: hypothetical protein AAF567_00680 [Actinomycetota bacterium]